MLVHVKHGATTHDLELSATASMHELQEQIATVTGVFVRHQKLILKGKVLDASKPLAAQGVIGGAKLMLMQAGTGGAPLVTKGQQAASTASQLKAEEAKARLESAYAAARGGAGALAAAAAAAAAAGGGGGSGVAVSRLVERQRAWRATGVITLRELNLTALPHHLLLTPTTPSTTTAPATAPRVVQTSSLAAASGTVAAAAPDPASAAAAAAAGDVDAAVAAAWAGWSACTRGLDVCHNKLTSLPTSLSALTNLTTLRCSRNQLASFPWPALAHLTCLTLLALDNNLLTEVPDGALSALVNLRVLSLAGNQVARLPPDVGLLRDLQVLDVTSNRLEALPEELGQCLRLTEVCASDNVITSLPCSLAASTALQALRLDKNRINALPSGLLRGATSLWLLSLTGNPISLDQLRCTDGYAELDQRRRSRADKQIESDVMLDGSSAFSEGADVQHWDRWK